MINVKTINLTFTVTDANGPVSDFFITLYFCPLNDLNGAGAITQQFVAKKGKITIATTPPPDNKAFAANLVVQSDSYGVDVLEYIGSYNSDITVNFILKHNAKTVSLGKSRKKSGKKR